MVVAPGFIDLHSHGQDHENYVIQARDGVTTALELEVGAGDIDSWYSPSVRVGQSVNFGASAWDTFPVRIDVMNDPGEFPAGGGRGVSERPTPDELSQRSSRASRKALKAGPSLWASGWTTHVDARDGRPSRSSESRPSTARRAMSTFEGRVFTKNQ